MANFIGKIQIGANGPLTLIGSTAYGICNTDADNPNKVLTVPWNGDTNNNSNDGNKYINSEYPDSPIIGSTIHIKFVKGNTATTNLTLQIRNDGSAYRITGMPICGENTVLSLTYDEYVINNDNANPSYRWIVNDNADTNTTYAFTGDRNGNPITQQPSSGAYFTVTPSSSSTTQYVPITGLAAGAYKDVATTTVNNNDDNDKLPTVSAVKGYITAATNALGITGAMHFRGTATVSITNNSTNHYPHINGYDLEDNNEKPNFSPEDGDVILYNSKEFVWASGAWHELGDESSYLLADSITDSPISVSGGATPTFGVSDGVLTITPGTDVTYSGPSQVYIPVSTTPAESP